MGNHRGRKPLVTTVIWLGLLLLAGSWNGSTAWAGDRAAGREKASAVCQNCHGLDGLSRQPDAPNIAGQNVMYMREQLRAYRSGKRTHPVMNVVAKDLSDEDIDNLTAYFSSIEITVKVPE